MAAHSSILAWRVPMDRGAGWATIPSVTESGHDLACMHTHCILLVRKDLVRTHTHSILSL